MYYYIADIEIKPNKMKEYHEYWQKNGPANHLKFGAEHVGTFNVIAGPESTTHVKRLFKITDLDAWARGEKKSMYHSDYWAELCYDVKCTLMIPEDYSPLK